MATLSAAHTTNGVANPAEHPVAYGSTVNLALLSLNGVSSVVWEVLSASKSGTSFPTITPAGTPTGATASFVMPSDPGDGLGRSFLVRCTVSNSVATAQEYSVIGAVNMAGVLPMVPGEQAYRNATQGWTDVVNRALAGLTASWASVLAVGNTSGANNPIIADAQYLQLGTTNPASAGTIRLRNAATIYWRNGANTADLGFRLDASDNLIIGQGGASPSVIGFIASSTINFQIGSNTMFTYYAPFANTPGIGINSDYGNGAGSAAIMGFTTPSTTRGGMDLWVFGGAGNGTNQAGGNVKLFAGAATGAGTPAGVILGDASQNPLLTAIADATNSRVEIDCANLEWAASVASPTLWQANQTGNGVNGQALTVQAQNSTGTTTIGGTVIVRAGTGTTRAGDLLFYCGGTQVGLFTLASPTRFQIATPAFFFDTIVTAPTIQQGDNGTASATGQTLTLQAQNTTGSASTGGQLTLKSGTGLLAAGNLVLAVGNTTALTLNPVSNLAELTLPIFRFAIGTATPSITQADQTAASTAGQKLTIHAQNATGTTSTGGAFDLATGTGTTAAGLGRLLAGATVDFSWNATGIGLYTATPVAQATRVGQITIGAGTPGTSTADVGTTFNQTTLNNNFATIANKINLIESRISQAGGGIGLTA